MIVSSVIVVNVIVLNTDMWCSNFADNILLVSHSAYNGDSHHGVERLCPGDFHLIAE